MAVKLGNGNWAVKEDKLLAYNDNSGLFFNKEFDFSRGTSATYVAKDGLIKTAGIQPNVVSNGDFSDGSTDWTLGSDWTVGDSKVIGDNSDTESTQQIFPDNTSRLLRIRYTLTVDSGEVAVYMSGQVKDWKTTSGTYTDTITTTSKTIEFDGRNASPFSGTITNITVQEIQTDTPRIDFTNDTKGHLLLEPSRTNLYPYSNFYGTGGLVAFSGGTSSFTATNNYAISLDGTQNAIRFEASIGSTSSDRVGLRQLLTMTATDGTLSFYGKSNTSSNQTIAFHFNGATRTVVTLTNEWQRFTFTDTSSTVNNAGIEIRGTYTDTSVDVLLFGFQMEQASYPTSYIPTTGAASTRNADVCNNSGSAQDFNSEEGVLYAEIAALADDGTYRLISISDGSHNNRVVLGYGTPNNSFLVQLSSGGAIEVNSFISISDATDFTKVAFKYKQNDVAIWVNGSEVETDTSATMPIGLSQLSFDYPNAFRLYGKCKQLIVFTEALTDEQLEKLTS